MNSNDTIRAFVALEVPEEGRIFLGSVATDLRRTRADVKWVRPEAIHITLKFLGEIAKDLISDIERDLTPVFAELSPFRLTIRGLGAFPNLARVRVIWAGIHEEKACLSSVAGRVETVLEPYGFAREKRPFSPHLTLGRARSGKGMGELVDAIRQKLDLTGPSFVARHAVLFQSILKPTGAEYRALRHFPFCDR